MTQIQFTGVLAYIEAGCGKSLPQTSAKVYYDLLGDLDFQVLMLAAQRVILEHPWSTFPSIAELRDTASATMRGCVSDMSSAEAWRIAWRAARLIDPEVDGSVSRHCKDIPPIVLEAMKTFGIVQLCYAEKPEVARSQFMKIFEAISARQRRMFLLPPAMKEAVASIGQVLNEAKQIGVMPE